MSEAAAPCAASPAPGCRCSAASPWPRSSGLLPGLEGGTLEVRLPGGDDAALRHRRRPCGSRSDDARFFRRLATRGKLGLGESYTAGEWRADDLVALLRAAAAQRRRGGRAATRACSRAARAAAVAPRAQRPARRAPQHRLPLRPRQRPVRAVPRRDDDVLLRGLRATTTSRSPTRSDAKLRRICEQPAARPGRPRARDRLRLGVVRAASRPASTAPASPGSRSRASRPRSPAPHRGRRPRRPVEIREQDYRAVEGTFTKVASIEMLEAIGERQFGTYFATIDRVLAPGGLACSPDDPRPRPALGPLPPHARLDRALRLPGLPDPLARRPDPRHGAPNAARDLRARRDRPALRRDAAPLARELPRADRRGAPLGYDERFERTWDFYLAFCEAAFRMRALARRPAHPRQADSVSRA